jgi:hypothetical protein
VVEALAVAVGDLPEGANVGVLVFIGSLAPITLAHAAALTQARALLLGEPGGGVGAGGSDVHLGGGAAAPPRPARMEVFKAVVAVVGLNSDQHVGAKVAAAGQRPLPLPDRAALVRLALQDLPWAALGPGGGRFRAGEVLHALAARLPHVRLQLFFVNGADDVLKCRKWMGAGPHKRLITLGRVGSTEAVVAAARAAGVDLDDGCVAQVVAA